MKNLTRLYLFLIFVFLYAPILVLIVLSFNESRSRATWTGFTFHWYIQLFHDASIMEALTNTLTIAVISSLAATIIGTAAAIGIHSLNRRARAVIMNITNLPVLNPDIVTGISLMILFIFAFNILQVGRLGFTTILLSHITFNIPYVILAILPRLRQLDDNLYEAALDLGAKPSYAFLHVILPEIMPSVITGAVLAFTLSLDDFIVTFFTTDRKSTRLNSSH